MTQSLAFNPLVPLPVIAGLALLAIAMISLGVAARLAGWPWRACAAALLLATLTGPSWRQEERRQLDDIVVVAVDTTDSQRLGVRESESASIASAIASQMEAWVGTRVHRVDIAGSPDNAGSQLVRGLADAISGLPPGQLAGAILVSDGQAHDADRPVAIPAPLHLLLSGRKDDRDRSLRIVDAPSFGIVGEQVSMTLRVEHHGPGAEAGDTSLLHVAVGPGERQSHMIPVGQDIEVAFTLQHSGTNVVHVFVPGLEGELTGRNNSALIRINGVRDRLRVLLVTGQPHPGTRTWRNLLKSDSSVELVHFTILRPPEKHDGVPINELSLIAFPTRELFLEKISDFDLIIFDRYRRRGFLPATYMENVRDFVLDGGAVLISAGPEFASAYSLYRTPLEDILPASPTARVITEAFTPAITETGHRHPVSREFQEISRLWGRWHRQVELEPVQERGDVLMSGAGGAPLLLLDRVGDGRVALLASDQAWLWSRDYDGGGPHLELLRRLAHWLMKEPELDEETLEAVASGGEMLVVRETLGEEVGPVTITSGDGEQASLDLAEVSPGRFEAVWQAPGFGLYKLEEGGHTAFAGLGPASPREYEQAVASAEPLKGVVASHGGGILRTEDGPPTVRKVRPGQAAAGRGWIGITPRHAHQTLSIAEINLLPVWATLLAIASLSLIAWLREGRR